MRVALMTLMRMRGPRMIRVGMIPMGVGVCGVSARMGVFVDAVVMRVLLSCDARPEKAT